MVCQPEVFDVIEGDETVFEKKPLVTLAKEKQLQSKYHDGFWKCMDTARDKKILEELWGSGQAPWKVWLD